MAIASQSSAQVVLDWPDVLDGTTSYTIERRWRQGEQPPVIFTTTASTFTDTNGGAGFAPNEPYRYRVYATNSVGDSPFSEPVFATLRPSPFRTYSTSQTAPSTPVIAPKPSAGGYVYCPTYGAKIMRVTDAEDGADGYNVVNDAANYPSYAQVTPSGHSAWTWANTTIDSRGLQKSATGSTERIAATWFSDTQFEIDVNLIDGLTHRVALYCLDWDYGQRTQTVEVRDASTDALLDTRSISSFSGGKYVVWNLRGHVKLKVIRTGGYNSVVSGLFFN